MLIFKKEIVKHLLYLIPIEPIDVLRNLRIFHIEIRDF